MGRRSKNWAEYESMAHPNQMRHTPLPCGDSEKGCRLEDRPPDIGIPLAWVGAEELPVHLVNQFLCQFNQDEFILTVGQMVPPALVAPTPEERLEEAEQISYVPIKPLARLAFTRQRLVELVATLQANIDQYDEFQRQQNPMNEGPMDEGR